MEPESVTEKRDNFEGPMGQFKWILAEIEEIFEAAKADYDAVMRSVISLREKSEIRALMRSIRANSGRVSQAVGKKGVKADAASAAG